MKRLVTILVLCFYATLSIHAQQGNGSNVNSGGAINTGTIMGGVGAIMMGGADALGIAVLSVLGWPLLVIGTGAVIAGTIWSMQGDSCLFSR